MRATRMPTRFKRTVSVRILLSPVLTLILLLAMRNHAVASDDSMPSITTSPLSLDQVVANLVRKNEERAQNLLHSEATRVYHVTYRGFPGDREAEMTVEACYDSPSTKDFKIVSQSGSKIILERVFKRLLESEKEAAQLEVRSRTQLNRDNYDFALIDYQSSANQYVLQVSPKSKSKYLYRGRVWVDGNDFAVTRIEAEPAQNPSFWTKKSEIHHEYAKIQHSWLPVRNLSVSHIRLGGLATLIIEYKDYHLTEAHEDSASASARDMGSLQ